MRIVFFGTPEFANDFLIALERDEDISVEAVVAQPDKPVGRKQIITPPPTKMVAEENDIPVFQPTSLKDPAFEKALRALAPDLFVIVAYGKIIPQAVLDIPTLGNINVHPSKLPKYRGPSPLQAAIASGETETAVSIMRIDAQMDHGPILAQVTLPIEKNETPETLRKKVSEIGAPLLVETIKNYASGNITPVEQDHSAATFCHLLTKEDGRMNWNEPGEVIERKIRAYTPWPGTWTTWNGNILKIHKAELALTEEHMLPGEIRVIDKQMLIGTGDVPIVIHDLQPEGKARMTAQAFLNGNATINGTHVK